MSSLRGACKRQTEEIWNRLYPNEAYDFDFTKALSENASETLSGLEKHTEYDLVSAVKRQSPFFYQVSPRMIEIVIFLVAFFFGNLPNLVFNSRYPERI